MTVSLSLTESQTLEALRAFLLDILAPGVEVIRGQINRVPTPKGPNFVVMTPGHRRRLSTNIVSAASSTPGGPLDEVDLEDKVEVTIQLDIFGEASADEAEKIKVMLRSDYACDFFEASDFAVAPLYADDPQQLPFINGQKQWESRWVLNAVLQANPVATTVQQYADSVNVGLVEVDTTYPPGDA